MSRPCKTLWYCPEWGNFYRDNKRAGCLHNIHGYRVIYYKGKCVREHRLVFLYMEGSLPKKEVDHINRIRDDNRWCNLRHSSYKDNNENKVTNNSFIGVYWEKDRLKWRVRSTRSHIKRKELGRYKTHLAACYARWFYDTNN